VEERSVPGSGNGTTAVAVGAVEPAVEAVLEAVGPVLLVARSEAGEENFTKIRFAVVVGIFGVEISGTAQMITPLRQGMTPFGKFSCPGRRWIYRTCRPDPCLAGKDSTAGFAFAVDAERVVAHLNDPVFAVSAPLEGDWVFDQRFAGHEFDLKPGWTLMLARESSGESGLD
jgi:hypothetical protein